MDPVSADLKVAEFCALMRRDAQLRLERARATRRSPDAPCPAPAATEIRLGEEMTRTLERFVDRVVADELLPEDFEDGGHALPEGLAEALIAASAAAPTASARPLTTGAARRRALGAQGRAGMLHRALLRNDFDMAAPALDATLDSLGLAAAADDRAVLARAALRVLAGVHMEESQRELGMRGLRPEHDPVLAALSLPQTAGAACPRPEIQPVTPPGGDHAAASKRRGGEPKLGQDAMFSAVIAHAAACGRKPGQHGKTARDLEVARRLFLEFVGDRPMATLSWVDVAVLREEALRLPRMHGRSIFAKLTPSRAVELADALDEGHREFVVEVLGEPGADAALRCVPVERMSKKTINKHLSSLAGAARWWCNANRSEHRQRNWTPFAGEFFPKSETREDVRVIRTALTDSEISLLFTSPRFTGHSGDRLRTLAGPDIQRDGRYWAPLIGLYSGLRLEEILQLQPRDINVLHGVTVFCIGRRADFQVKSPAARRLVPVHPLLVRLGLLDHIADMRRKGERQLFPELERGGPDQRFGYAFSKDFTEYRRAIGAYEPGRDFHALRHSVSTALFNAGVDTSVVSAILGHAQVGVSAGVYLSGYKLAKLAEAITALDFGLDEVLMRRGRG
jgi:integrase